MASSSADCVLGVARLISSARIMLLKMGPGWKLKVELPDSSFTIMLVPVTSRRHKVGGELNAGEGHIENSSQRSYQPGLADAGYAFKQHVAACYHCNYGALDYIVLADYVASYLREYVFTLLAELLNVLLCYHKFRFPCNIDYIDTQHLSDAVEISLDKLYSSGG